MVKIILIFLSFFLSQEVMAEIPCKAGILGYSNSSQSCNRCFFKNATWNQNCYTRAETDDYLTTVITSELINFQKKIYQYKLQHWRCSIRSFWSNWTSSDGCEHNYDSDPITIKIEEILDNPDDCLKEGKLLSLTQVNPEDPYTTKDLRNKICAARVTIDTFQYLEGPVAELYDQSYLLGEPLICLFWIENNKPVGRACVHDKSMVTPPPFTPGIVPQIAFIVPEVKDPSKLSNFSFFKPGGQIQVILGDIIQSVVDLNLNLMTGKVFAKKNYSDLLFSTEITKVTPDKLNIKLHSGNDTTIIGTFPRPALEERPDVDGGSFFPCYTTYSNKFNEKFQAVEIFRITALPGDLIGPALYLGPHSLPSRQSDILGDLNLTQCDLCINAKKNDDLYGKGYSLADGTKITACNLNPQISITAVKLENIDDTPFTYRNIANDQKRDKDKDKERAPLRIDYLSELEMIEEKKQPNIKLDIGYKSDSAWLEGFFAEVKPIIPKFDQQNPSFLRAIITEDRQSCKIYKRQDKTSKGLLFIEAAGQRDRSFCNKKNDLRYFNDKFALCEENSNDVSAAVCHGNYRGASDPSLSVPDKLCITTANKWDFIKGGYNWGEKTTTDFMPGLACSFLPSCKNNLGPKPVPNIGDAIWNDSKTYAFNRKGKGACQDPSLFSDPQQSQLQEIFTYQYDVIKYLISPEAAAAIAAAINSKVVAELQTELSQLVAQKVLLLEPFLREADLRNTKLDSFYKTYPGLFICAKKIPTAPCIGGIYGDLEKKTNCVSLTRHESPPVKCSDILP